MVWSIRYGLNSAGSPNRYAKTISSLDDEAEKVIKLSALTAGISTAITLIPDDTGTPIAEHLISLTDWMFIVIIVLFLEKYSITLIGKLVFVIIGPIAIGMLGFGILTLNRKILMKAFNILLIAFVTFSAIPFSVKLSNEMQEMYNFSLDNTLAEGENAKNKTDEASAEKTEDENFIAGAISKVTSAMSDVVLGGVKAAEKFLNTLIESLAILVITSCVIPLITLFLFIWIIKVLIGIDLSKSIFLLHDHMDKSFTRKRKKEDSK
jgi:hypothetical protein